MNPVFIIAIVAIAVAAFFVVKFFKKKETPTVKPVQEPINFGPTASFVESVSIEADHFAEAEFQPSQVLEVAPAPEVLFEKLPEAAPMEVQAEAPKPKTAAKPKAKKAAVKKKPAAKK
jgi:hypothetical protein